MDGLQLNILLTLVFLAGLAIGAAAMWAWMGRKLEAAKDALDEEKADSGLIRKKLDERSAHLYHLANAVWDIRSYLEPQKSGTAIKTRRMLDVVYRSVDPTEISRV